MSRNNKIGTTATKVTVTSDGYTRVQYHKTEVVAFTPDKAIISLDTGGWFTNTTKLRMNQASMQFDLGYQVYQKNHDWFVEFEGKTIKFSEDIIFLFREREVNGLPSQTRK